MPRKISPAIKPSVQATRTSEPTSLPQPRMSSAPLLNRPLPTKSVDEAKSRFKNFSLSKFPKGSLPLNHVAEAKNQAACQAIHKKVIARQIEKHNNTDITDSGLTLALPDGMVKKFLPSYDANAGTIDLGDLVSLLAKKMRGTEFYSNGNPTLSRLALQSQVTQVLQTIKKEAKP